MTARSGEEAIEVARAAGALREEGYALNTLGGALCRLGESEAAVGCLEHALEIAETVGSVDDLRRGFSNLAVVLEEIGWLRRAVDVGRAGIERLDALGYEAGKGNVRCTTASALRSAGAWQDGDLLAAQALQDSTSDHILWMGREVRGSIAARRGDFAAAHAFLEPAGEDWSTGYADFRADLDAARIELALGEGRRERARELIDDGLAAFAGSEGQHHHQRLIALGLRAHADDACRNSTSAKERAVAQERARRLIESSRAMPRDLASRGIALTARSSVLRALCEAEYARAEGRHDPALWQQAAHAWAQIPQPYELAYARWRQAEAHLATADRDGAAVAVREAATIAADLGAAPLLTQIQALARRARIRLTATAQSADGAHAANLGLSARELQVLALVAAGHTNREIATALYITEKTASVHVSHILTKLGVSNRGQAGAVAQRLDLLSEPSAG